MRSSRIPSPSLEPGYTARLSAIQRSTCAGRNMRAGACQSGGDGILNLGEACFWRRLEGGDVWSAWNAVRPSKQ